jgi:hypothetical protein
MVLIASVSVVEDVSISFVVGSVVVGSSDVILCVFRPNPKVLAQQSGRRFPGFLAEFFISFLTSERQNCRQQHQKRDP